MTEVTISLQDDDGDWTYVTNHPEREKAIEDAIAILRGKLPNKITLDGRTIVINNSTPETGTITANKISTGTIGGGTWTKVGPTDPPRYHPGTMTPVDYYKDNGDWQRQTKINQQEIQIKALQSTIAAQQLKLRDLQDKAPSAEKKLHRTTTELNHAAEELQMLVRKMKRATDDEQDGDWYDEDDDGSAGVREPRRPLR